jgi:glycosyltransferase involved in cell wall biosynthesis
MNEGPIILFEPVCRGSRLQILANTVSAIRTFSNRPIKIVTRSDYENTHLRELMGANRSDVEFVLAQTDLDGAWIKILTLDEMKAMLIALDRATANCGPSLIVFMALDDYLKPLVPHLWRIRSRFPTSRIFVMKYRVEYLLLARCMNWRAVLMSALTRLVLLRMRARLICFDERFMTTIFFGNPVAVIPDPWFGDFSPLRRKVARAKYGYRDNEFVVLTLGRQDRRKGFPLVLDILPELLSDTNSRLFVVGKVDRELIDRFGRLKNLFQEQITHIERFIDEAELPDVFASADVFLLPYALDFTATSGTLSRAAASCVPVVSGDHGLVGHRIKKYGLGEVFKITNANNMMRSIAAIRSYTADQRMKVAKALEVFAASAHINVFKESVGKLFNLPKDMV